MIRTNIAASVGRSAVGAAPMRKGSSRAARRLLVLPLVLLADGASCSRSGALAHPPGKPAMARRRPDAEHDDHDADEHDAEDDDRNDPDSGTSPSKERANRRDRASLRRKRHHEHDGQNPPVHRP